MSEPTRCRYEISWVGRCSRSAAEGSDYCHDHAGKQCCVCGEQASHECNHTGQFVCGAPMCVNCEPSTDTSKASGSWGFMNHTHRRKIVAPVRCEPTYDPGI